MQFIHFLVEKLNIFFQHHFEISIFFQHVSAGYLNHRLVNISKMSYLSKKNEYLRIFFIYPELFEEEGSTFPQWVENDLDLGEPLYRFEISIPTLLAMSVFFLNDWAISYFFQNTFWAINIEQQIGWVCTKS